MDRLKSAIRKLFFPGIPAIIICAPVAAALLIYTFAGGHDNTPIGYFSYLFSAYALTIVCIKIPTMIKYISRRVHNNKTAHRYLTDIPFRIRVSLYMSLGINALYASIKLFTGIYYCSVWFITLSVYYIMLAVMRFLLLRHIKGNYIGTDYISELKRYRVCGGVLLGMNAALSGMAVLVVIENRGIKYAGYLIYAMAAYTFYTTIISIRNVIKYRKLNSPILSAAKAINLAAALVSMLSLETAMLAQFGNGDDIFRRNITAITSGAVCVTVLGMAVFMLISSTVKLNKNRQ